MSVPAAEVIPSATPSATPAPAAPANQSFFNDWIKADAPEGKETREWLGSKNFPDPATLVKSYREMERESTNLRTAVNLKAYPGPTKNADGSVKAADENLVKAWNTSMGVPESADKYDIPMPSNNPYPQFKTYMAEEMHKAHVPAALATEMAKGYERAVARMEAEFQAQEKSQSKLKLAELESAWGSNYQERTALAKRAEEWIGKEMGGLTDVQKRTLEGVLGTDKWMTMLWKFGAGNKEASFASNGGAPPAFGNTASAAQAELNQITADRAAGKISDYQWRSVAGRVDELVKIISDGMAPRA